jgi:hypothetical protein
MNLIAGTLLALAASSGQAPMTDDAALPPPEPPAAERQLTLQLACAVAQELRMPYTCSEIRLRVIVAMSRPQLV